MTGELETREFGVVCTLCGEGTEVTVTPMRHNRAVNYLQVAAALRHKGWRTFGIRRYCPACRDDTEGVPE